MLRGGLSARVIVCAFLLIGVLRIISTYPVFTQTYDEPAHIAAGMEWLANGSYRYDPQHTPLPRIAAALGPYFAGVPFHHHPDMWTEGNAILASGGAYWRNLTIARIGILPFYVLACLFTYFLARRMLGQVSALLALFLFSTIPVVLGHAGLATADVAAVAAYTGATWAFLVWIERPSRRSGVLLGCAVAFAILTRLSNIPMLAFTAGAILLLRRSQIRWNRKSILAAVACCALLILAAYRFSFSPVLEQSESTRAKAMGFGLQGNLRDLQFQLTSIPLPASQLFRGLYRSFEHNSEGHASYLKGKYSQKGWWNFFLIELLYRTPIPLLILSALGLLLMWLGRQQKPSSGISSRVPVPPTVIWRTLQRAARLQPRLETGWVTGEPAPGLQSGQVNSFQLQPLAISAASVLFTCTIGNVHLGARHLLPIYPPLAILAAYAATQLWTTTPKRALVSLLLAWCAIASIRPHPDYLSYFNEFAGDHPERILSGSDLDWGQDLHRLSVRLNELRVQNVKIRYAGSADLSIAGLPAYEILQPNQRATGYVAISLRYLTLDEARARAQGQPQGPYAWLLQQAPLEKIGTSILLYKL